MDIIPLQIISVARTQGARDAGDTAHYMLSANNIGEPDSSAAQPDVEGSAAQPAQPHIEKEEGQDRAAQHEDDGSEDEQMIYAFSKTTSIYDWRSHYLRYTAAEPYHTALCRSPRAMPCVLVACRATLCRAAPCGVVPRRAVPCRATRVARAAWLICGAVACRAVPGDNAKGVA